MKKSVKTVNSRTGKEAMDNCFDIQAGLQELLEPSKVRDILLSIFSPKPNGLVSKLDVTNQLIFRCMCTGARA